MSDSNIKIWGWDKKKRTMIRFIKPGDIFCFRLNEQEYCFGRIISETSVGHFAEVFDYIAEEPTIADSQVELSSRLIDPVVLDSYSLFDKKTEGEWRIIGHQQDYIPTNVENVYFVYGMGIWSKITDVYGNVTPIDEKERSKYPLFAPEGDDYVTELVLEFRNFIKNI